MRRSYHAVAEQILDKQWGLIIGGKVVAASGDAVYEDTSPVDGRRLGDVPLASAADAARAVDAAKQALPGWRATPVAERSIILAEATRVLREHAEELGVLDSVDSGNPARAMISEVEMACDWLDYARGIAMEVKGATLPAPRDRWLMTRREPYGVVLRITAYNHPIMFAIQKLGAPLLTGNTMVLKVPQQTPLAPLRMGELLNNVLPAGVLNVMTGRGSDVGDALVRHPDVKRISLIGGISTAQTIQKAAAESGIKHVSLELGGKNPMIVLADADVETAAAAAVRGMNFSKTQGQSCGSCSRLFVHKSLHKEVVQRIVELLQKIKIGDPLDSETEMGSLVSHRERDRIQGMIKAGIDEGATLRCGGGPPPGWEDGAFLSPTVFDNVTMDMHIGRDEVFGPVLSVLPWDDPKTMLDQVNEVPFGLTASIITKNIDDALHLANQLDTGYVWINDCAQHYIGAPFSGHRNSGTDAEEDISELYSFTQVKTIAIALGTSPFKEK